jgi:hypothetical protein
MGSGVQLGPLGTTATDWPIVNAPGDYDNGEFGGMKFDRGNQSTQRKPTPAPLCPPQSKDCRKKEEMKLLVCQLIYNGNCPRRRNLFKVLQVLSALSTVHLSFCNF